MKSAGLFTQLIIVAAAAGIVMLYVKPTLGEIGAIQDKIGQFVKEKDKVTTVNSELSAKLSQMQSVSSEDKKRLFLYLPEELDDIAVMRDIYIITQMAGVTYNEVTYESSDESSRRSRFESPEGEGNDPTMPENHDFALSVEGTYFGIKGLLALLEENEYPLEVFQMEIQGSGGGLLAVELGLRTYTFKPEPITVATTTESLPDDGGGY